jgi:hypothetical protein
MLVYFVPDGEAEDANLVCVVLLKERPDALHVNQVRRLPGLDYGLLKVNKE